MSDGLNDLVPQPLGGSHAALRPCRPRTFQEAIIRKHAPSLLPGDCVNPMPHACKLTEVEDEPAPITPPRVGTHVRVRWREGHKNADGLMLVFRVRSYVEPWEVDEADVFDEDAVKCWLDGWTFEEGHRASAWVAAVPHVSVDGDRKTTAIRWEHIDA